jgi:hypothetical protein
MIPTAAGFKSHQSRGKCIEKTLPAASMLYREAVIKMAVCSMFHEKVEWCWRDGFSDWRARLSVK